MTRAACEAVHRYVPNPSVPWQNIDVTVDAPLDLSCAGEFKDPALNVEQRRFLFRDVIPFAVFVAAFIGYGVVGLGSILLGSAPGGAFLFQHACVFVVGFSTVFAGGYAHFCGNPLNPRTSIVLIVSMMAYCGFGAGVQVLFEPSQRVLACGDTETINAFVNASDLSAAANATRVAIAEATADRQQYCIDAIDTWFIGGIVTGVVIFKMLPVHATVTSALTFCLVPVGFVLRDYVIARDEEFETDPISVATTMLVLAGCLGISVVRNVRQAAVDRERFLAAVGAERARRRAMAELRQVDALLRRALPETVLQRVSEGLSVADESDSVTVVLVAIRCQVEAPAAGGGGAPSRGDETGGVALLQRAVCKFDELLGSEETAATMTKVKTVGDMYWAMSGLPDAVSCHASAACRFVMNMHSIAAVSFSEATDSLPSPQSRTRTNSSVRLRTGVHTGHAAAAMFGVNCLSYEPLGEACDGCQKALQHCPPDLICVTDAVKRRLAVEAQRHALADDHETQALYKNAGDVDTALDVIATEPGNSGHRVYYSLGGEHHRALVGALLPGVAEGADTITVRSHQVDTMSTFTSTGFDPEAVDIRQAHLERRLKYLLQRADEAKQRSTRARPFAGKARYAIIRPTRPDEDHAPNRHATELLAELEDPANGPFAPATCVPLVYTFRDGEEERGFLDYASRVTYTLRRDVRTATAAFFWVCAAWYAGTGDGAVGMCLFFVAASVGTGNAAIMWLRRWDRADPALACLSMAVFIGALWAADEHTLGNDPDWGFLLVFLSVLLTEWTLSPLVRLVVMLALNVLSSSKLVVVGQRSIAEAAPGFVTAACGIAVVVTVAEKYSRRSYIERRLAEALLGQQQAALQAQEEVLRSMVPPDVAASAHAWMVGGCEPSQAVMEHLGTCAVAVVKMCRGTDGDAVEPTMARLEWLLGQHTAFDAMMERCCVAQKIKTEGDTILLLGRASVHEWEFDGGGDAESPAAAADDDTDTPPPRDIGRGALGAFVAEVVCVAQSFAWTDVRIVAGVAVGPVVGAVLGSERLSYDVLGAAVQTARQTMIAATPPLRPLRDVARVAVATSAAYADAATTSSKSDVMQPVIALSADVITALAGAKEHQRTAFDAALVSDQDLTIALPVYGTLRSSEDGRSTAGYFVSPSSGGDGATVDSGQSLDLGLGPSPVRGVRAVVTAMCAGPGQAVVRVLRDE